MKPYEKICVFCQRKYSAKTENRDCCPHCWVKLQQEQKKKVDLSEKYFDR